MIQFSYADTNLIPPKLSQNQGQSLMKNIQLLANYAVTIALAVIWW